MLDSYMLDSKAEIVQLSAKIYILYLRLKIIAVCFFLLARVSKKALLYMPKFNSKFK